jgi:hypothetical protein
MVLSGLMNRVAYEKLRCEIEERYRADLDALERVWQLSDDSGRSIAANSASSRPGRRLKGLKRAVENAIGDLLAERIETFTIDHVIERIRRRDPELGRVIKSSPNKRASLSNALKRLVDGKKLGLHSTGTGSQANRYEFPEDKFHEFDEEEFEECNTNEEPAKKSFLTG